MTRCRVERGDSVVPFLLVMPLVMAIFWVILQVGLSTVAGVGAQQAASEAAREISDERGSRPPADICVPLQNFGEDYGHVIAAGPGAVSVSARGVGFSEPSCTGGWAQWERSPAVVCDGDGDGTGAFEGVEVVVDVDAVEVLPGWSGWPGLSVLDALNDVRAASCAPLRRVR